GADLENEAAAPRQAGVHIDGRQVGDEADAVRQLVAHPGRAAPGGPGDADRLGAGGQPGRHDRPDARALAQGRAAQAAVILQFARELDALDFDVERARAHRFMHASGNRDGPGQVFVARRAVLHGEQHGGRHENQHQRAQAALHEACSAAPPASAGASSGSDTWPTTFGLNQPGVPYRLSTGLKVLAITSSSSLAGGAAAPGSFQTYTTRSPRPGCSSGSTRASRTSATSGFSSATPG